MVLGSKQVHIELKVLYCTPVLLPVLILPVVFICFSSLYFLPILLVHCNYVHVCRCFLSLGPETIMSHTAPLDWMILTLVFL